MIQIKTRFNGWKEVDEKTALEFATHLYNGTTQKNMLDYINSEKLNGISFTEEQLIHNINSLKTEIISDKPIQVCRENIKQEKKGKTLDEMTGEERKEYEILLNRTAREEMKLKLEADIMRDIIVCNLMKEDARVYLLELKKIIDDTLNKIEVARYEKMCRLDYFGGCEKAGEVCEKYKKTIHRTITKLDKAENGVYEFNKLEVIENEKSNI